MRAGKDDAYAETSGACVSSQAPPCRRESCRYHLASGTRWRNRRPAEVKTDTCVLRLAKDRRTLEEVAVLLGCTRERVRQIEVVAMKKLARAMKGDT